MRPFHMIVDGRALAIDNSFPVINPATEEVLAQCPQADSSHVNQAVAAAKRAFPAWSQEADSVRKEKMLAIADAIEANADELAELLVMEQGKPLEGFAGLGAQFEVNGAALWTRATAAMDLPVEVIQDNEEARVEVRRKPLGVVASITPWNFPLMIAIWHIIPGLRVGNTIVLKPSEYTPLTTLRLAEIINDILPPGVCNVITGHGATGGLLSAHPDVAKIVFTGSTATGKKIMSAAATTLKRLTLELGGNDAGIVLPDTDVQAMAPKIFTTALLNSGQTCAALKRLYVHEDIYDQMCSALTDIANSVTVGSGFEGSDYGPVQNKAQYHRICELVDEAKAQGARILTGGEPLPGKGYFYPITLLADIAEGVRLVDEEPFGPVLPIIKYSDLDDAIARANNSCFGLGGSIWSSDIARATELANRLECGTTWINNHAMVQPDAPFGGTKESGIGVEFGRYGLEEYTCVHTVQISK